MVGSVFAAAGAWDYKKNGADWPDLKSKHECNGGNQSPIDLTKSATHIEQDYDLNKMYYKYSSAAAKFDKYTSVAAYSILPSVAPNGFYSSHNHEYRETSPMWNAA